MRLRVQWAGAFLCIMLLPINVAAQKADSDKKVEKKAVPPPPRWTFAGSLRVRPEFYSWFPVEGADYGYTFTAAVLRLGVTQQTPKDETMLEIEAPYLIDLPGHASVAAPKGQLGQGGSYRDANGNQSASLFVKQAFVRLKNFGTPTSSLKLGRFEFSDGQETVPSDPSLAWLKQNRIGQRLIGPFSFTHVGRSFDGFQFVDNKPKRNLTFLGVMPTRGVFDLKGGDTLTGVKVAYLAVTIPQTAKSKPIDARLFGVYYEDTRDPMTKTDNRPLAQRTADHNPIKIGTFGFHYLRTQKMGAGKLDTLLWAAGQLGSWGSQNQGAYSFSAEIGYQPAKMAWKPWLRAGYFVASGDGNPANNQHGTFFPMLPTPRLYARFPFFTESNLKDLFGQLILRPNPRLTLRPEVHALWLADSNDLWYGGGGAFQDKTFGYAGRPGKGARYLGTLEDVSFDYQWNKTTNVNLYFAHVDGGGVIQNVYGQSTATFGYLELVKKF